MAESSQEETDNETGTQQKRVAKKKHYPFGTPSHTTHPFSEFAHLPVDTRTFALNLATATDIKPEVIEEEPQRRRPRPAPVPKKKKHSPSDDADDEEEEEGGGSKSKTDNSDLAPCTKIPCQLVLRAIADIEYKNEIEKLDLEDEYERLLHDLKSFEQDVHTNEQRLEKMNDFGNNLEIKLNQIMNKVEQFEKTKEQLLQERTEINTKLMLIEVERQKANRRFDKAQKQLADARWRKKKKAQLQDIEQGLTLPPSEIAENKIIHVDQKTITSQEDIYVTPYHLLVRDSATDILEKSQPVKTIPTYLQEKFFEENDSFDKYTQRYYEKIIHHSLDSWKHTEGTLLANSVDTVALLHPYDPSSQRHFRKKTEQLQEDSTFQESSYSRNQSRKSLGSRTRGKTANLSASISSLGLGSSIGSPSSPSRRVRTGRSPERQSWKSKSLSVLDSIHSLIKHSEEKFLDDVSSVKSGATTSTFDLSLNSLPSNTTPLPNQQHPNKVGKKADHPNPIASSSLISSRRLTKKYLQPLGPYDLTQMNSSILDSERLNNFLDTLQEDGIYLNEGGLPLTTNQSYFQEKKLDKAFYRNAARSSWGRNGSKVGIVRSNSQADDASFNDNDTKSTADDGTSNLAKNSSPSPTKSVTTIRSKLNGADLIDYRSLPKLAAKTLTVKHPGMKTFADSISITASKTIIPPTNK